VREPRPCPSGFWRDRAGTLTSRRHDRRFRHGERMGQPPSWIRSHERVPRPCLRAFCGDRAGTLTPRRPDHRSWDGERVGQPPPIARTRRNRIRLRKNRPPTKKALSSRAPRGTLVLPTPHVPCGTDTPSVAFDFAVAFDSDSRRNLLGPRKRAATWKSGASAPRKAPQLNRASAPGS
jgi:hypothetical protein